MDDVVVRLERLKRLENGIGITPLQARAVYTELEKVTAIYGVSIDELITKAINAAAPTPQELAKATEEINKVIKKAIYEASQPVGRDRQPATSGANYNYYGPMKVAAVDNRRPGHGSRLGLELAKYRRK